MAGNANSGRRRTTYITDALLMEIKSREARDDKAGLRKMAVAIMDLAEAGERWAAEYVRDTIDGKPMQAVELSGSLDTKPNGLTDNELADIATGRSAGATETTPSPSKLN